MNGMEDKTRPPEQPTPYVRTRTQRHSSAHFRPLLNFRVIPRQNGAPDPILKSCRILVNFVLKAPKRPISESCPHYAVLLRIATRWIRSHLLLVRPRVPGEGLQRALSVPPLNKDVMGRA